MITMTSTLIILSKRNFSSKRLQPFYSILKVRTTSTPEEIRNSYIKLSKIYHPDNLQTGDEKRFIRIKEAYDKIMSEFPSTVRNHKSQDDDDPDLSHKAYIEYIRFNPPQSIPITPHLGERCTGKLYSSVKQRKSWIDKLTRKLIT